MTFCLWQNKKCSNNNYLQIISIMKQIIILLLVVFISCNDSSREVKQNDNPTDTGNQKVQVVIRIKALLVAPMTGKALLPPVW
jgi:hypothetical protein